MDYTSYESLFEAIQTAANVSLKTHVAPVVKEVEHETVNEVLDEYDPACYQRRKTDGLDDVNNMVDTVEGNTLMVVNNTEFNQTQVGNPNYYTSSSGIGLAGLVEYGDSWENHVYDYKIGDNVAEFTKPREFTKRTEEKLIATNAHVEAMREGLISQGFELK